MCMWDGDGDSPSIYRASTRRSRKERKCEECRRTIAVGERYHYAFMVYETYPSGFYTCEHCSVAMDWLIENCGGFAHGGVWEDLEEHISEYRTQAPLVTYELAKLKVAWRRQWRRFDGLGLMRVPPVPPVIEGAMHA